jgi:hypothetical protein
MWFWIYNLTEWRISSHISLKIQISDVKCVLNQGMIENVYDI